LSDACVDAPDVFVSMPVLFTCQGPTSHFFFIGNRGQVPFEGTMTITSTGPDTASVNPPAVTIAGPLAPGQSTQVLTWVADFGADVVVELADAEGNPVTDCDDTNQLVDTDGVAKCSCK
jgi:hypothetical protein